MRRSPFAAVLPSHRGEGSISLLPPDACELCTELFASSYPSRVTASDDSPGVDGLFDATYRELRQLARARLRTSAPNTLLDTTALVHETYLRLASANELQFPDRPRFLVYAGKVMRSVIVDFVRQRQTDRRGGDAAHVTFTTQLAGGVPASEEQILRVNDALLELEKVDERMAKVVELRYFGGLTEIEIAQALGVTDRTVRRDWEQARLFLADALK
jgi:RNA polymerase sigma factor (TIGR02999 family)